MLESQPTFPCRNLKPTYMKMFIIMVFQLYCSSGVFNVRLSISILFCIGKNTLIILPSTRHVKHTSIVICNFKFFVGHKYGNNLLVFMKKLVKHFFFMAMSWYSRRICSLKWMDFFLLFIQHMPAIYNECLEGLHIRDGTVYH